MQPQFTAKAPVDFAAATTTSAIHYSCFNAALIALAIAFLGIALPIATARADCNYGPNEVAFFKHGSYTGQCTTKGIGAYPNSGALDFPNDEMSSVRVGANAQVVLCQHADYGGRCQRFTNSDAHLSNNYVGNDAVTSAKVQPRGYRDCSPGAHQVAFYTDADHLGQCSVRDVGDYASSAGLGLPNDKMSSVLIGSDAQVVLCEHANYGGTCQRFMDSDAHLSNNNIGNDTVTSAKVQDRGFLDCVPTVNQVAVYRHAEYLGPCVVRDQGEYRNSGALGFPNDAMSSIRVGDNVQVVVCEDADYKGTCQRFTGNDERLSNDSIGNDTITSMKVQLRGYYDCAPGPREIALYQDAHYLGACVLKDMGDYHNSASLGIANDSITSLLVGIDAQAVLCKHRDFDGHCERFTSSDTSLSNNSIGNDTVTSAKVEPRGFVPCQPARNQVSFYEHSHYLGDCVVRDFGDYHDNNTLGISGITSISVGSDAETMVCVNTNYHGTCQLFKNSDPSVSNNQIGNDNIESARVQPLAFIPCDPQVDEASFYENAQYLGACRKKGIGQYANSAAIGLPDGSISSVRVGGSVQACVCSSAEFGGTCEKLTSHNASLSDNPIGNDSISSVKVMDRAAACTASTPSPRPEQGFSAVHLFNCHNSKRSVFVWTLDFNAGTGWDQEGILAAQYTNGVCPGGSDPLILTLEHGHVHRIVAVDKDGVGCGGENDPENVGCQRLSLDALGSSTGPVLTHVVP